MSDGFPLYGWTPPTFAQTLETVAWHTSEFRKLRLGCAAQIVEHNMVPETDSAGKAVCWGGGGTVLLASVAVVTKLRFDAWMQRLGGDDDA